MIESTHPYDNNLDQRMELNFPGALDVRIEFDPQCYLEPNYDVLYFYSDSGYNNLIKQFDGRDPSQFPPLTIPGDKVYYRFKTDGSGQYWGYKFNAIPNIPVKADEKEEKEEKKEDKEDPFTTWSPAEISLLFQRFNLFSVYLFQVVIESGFPVFLPEDALVLQNVVAQIESPVVVEVVMQTFQKCFELDGVLANWNNKDIMQFEGIGRKCDALKSNEYNAGSNNPNSTVVSRMALIFHYMQARNPAPENWTPGWYTDYSRFMSLAISLASPADNRKELPSWILESAANELPGFDPTLPLQDLHKDPRIQKYDRLLVQFVNDQARESRVDGHTLSFAYDEALSAKFLSILEGKQIDQSLLNRNLLLFRYLLVAKLNSTYYSNESLWLLIDFNAFPQIRSFLLFNAKVAFKKKICYAAKNGNWSYNEFLIKWNRGRAIGAEKHPFPGRLPRTMLGQAVNLFASVPLTNFWTTEIDYRPWKSEFIGEAGIDAGGLFRETVTMLTSDLLDGSPTGLGVLCPNGKFNVGQNREKVLLRASATHPMQLSMLEIVGRLIGYAFRSGYTLELDVAPIVWKKLVGEALADDELAGFDALAAQTLKDLQNLEDNGGESVDLGTWTTQRSDGSEVELRPGGANIPVAFEERKEYVDAVIRARLAEVDAQVEALKEGLFKVVPKDIINLFTGAEMEQVVCGIPEVDLQLMRRKTNYEGIAPDARAVQLMWQVLESFTTDQRRKFIRFAWGRSRLPLTEDAFTQPFKVCTGPSNPNAMPRAHTCFFQIDLPPYTEYDIARRQILYAIENATAMDGVDSVSSNEVLNID
jgi:hypothetical protein